MPPRLRTCSVGQNHCHFCSAGWQAVLERDAFHIFLKVKKRPRICLPEILPAPSEKQQFRSPLKSSLAENAKPNDIFRAYVIRNKFLQLLKPTNDL